MIKPQDPSKPCAGCAHAHYDASDAQHVCMHPDVSEPSAVTPSKRIGMASSAVRAREYSHKSRRCGPSGLWWQQRA